MSKELLQELAKILKEDYGFVAKSDEELSDIATGVATLFDELST